MGSPETSQEEHPASPGDLVAGSADSEQGGLGGGCFGGGDGAPPCGGGDGAPPCASRQAALTGNALKKHVLERLQQLALQRREQIQELEQERRDLRVRLAALHIAIRHCNATFQLAAALSRHGPRAPFPARLAAPLLELKRHLAGGAAGGEPPPEGAGAPLGWDPEAAAAAAAAGEYDLTPAGLEARMRDFNREGALRIGRVSRRAPNAGQAQQELEQLRADLLNFTAVYAMAYTNPSSRESMWRAFLVVVDAPEAGQEGRPPPPPPPPEHWRWALQQVAFDARQEDLVRALLAIWRARAVQLAQESEQHLAALERLTHEAPEDTDGQEALLAKVHDAQTTHTITHVVVAHAIYGSVMRAEQAAAWAVGAHPYVPSLASMEEGLQRAHDPQRQPQPQLLFRQHAQPQQ